jgi:hypothetical protein
MTIRKDKNYTLLISFCTGLVHKFSTASQENPVLFVEALFKHALPHRFCGYSTNLYVTEELRLFAERELLLDEQRRDNGAGTEPSREKQAEEEEDSDEELEFEDLPASSKPKPKALLDSDDDDDDITPGTKRKSQHLDQVDKKLALLEKNRKERLSKIQKIDESGDSSDSDESLDLTPPSRTTQTKPVPDVDDDNDNDSL